MKKLLVLLMLTMAICSSAFAECKLDMTRWKYIGSNNNCGFYCDTVSIDVNDDKSAFEVWECEYYPGNHSKCTLRTCEEKGIQSSEHYHYFLLRYNLKNRTFTTKSFSLRDSNGNILLTYDYPLHLQKTQNVVPDTSLETIMLRIKEHIDNPTASSLKVHVEPLFPVVINNVKREDVQKEFYQEFKKVLTKLPEDNTAISEDNQKIFLKSFIKQNGISNEEYFTILTAQQGKNVIVKGESTATLQYPDGKIVGPTRNLKGEVFLFALTSNIKKKINGYYRFGFSYDNNTDGYYVITEVASGHPFEKKGIKVGDILISVNGNQLKGLSKMELYARKILDPFSPDERIFEIKHNGETKQYTIKPKFVTPEELKKEKET